MVLKAQTYGGFWLNVKSKIKVKYSISKNEVEIEFLIIKNDNIKPLLSRDTCQKLGLLMQVVDMVTVSEKEKFMLQHKNIFKELGKFKYKITLKEGCVPVVRPPRRVPNIIKEKLKFTLGNLEKSGIIQKN